MTNTTKDTIRDINRLVDAGFAQIPPTGWRDEQIIAACDHWLQAWELVKSLVTPEMRNYEPFDAAYPALKEPLVNWLADLEMHLHNTGLRNSRYFEERLRFAREQLALFPDEDDNTLVNLRRAEGEALWGLGRQTEAEAVFQALVEQLPDNAWGYIGWADHYYNLQPDQPTDYPRAEAILLQAMARPNLEDRRDVIERLADLYEASGQQEKMVQLAVELEAEHQRLLAEKARLEQESETARKLLQFRAKKQQTPGRNDPCWCGSGKKYKQCHMNSDRQ